MENYPEFPQKVQYRLRAMATLEEFRRKGAGRLVVSFAENILRDRRVELLWCIGRIDAKGYYEKLGFRPHGEVFDYPPLGPHIIMYKQLSKIDD